MDKTNLDSLSGGYQRGMADLTHDVWWQGIEAICVEDFDHVEERARALERIYHRRGLAALLRLSVAASRRITVARLVKLVAWAPPWLIRLLSLGGRRVRSLAACRNETVKARMAALVASSRSESDAIGILGAGHRAVLLLGCTKLGEGPIRAVFDPDERLQGKLLHGHVVLPPDAIAGQGIRRLVVAAPELLNEQHPLVVKLPASGLEVIRVGEEWPPARPATPVEPIADLPLLIEDPAGDEPPSSGATPLVVYLIRGVEGPHVFERFMTSYRAVAEPMAHELLIIFKGFRPWNSRRAYQRALGGLDHRSLELEDGGYDIGAYAEAARRFNHPVYLFLNAFSTLLAPGWLSKMHRCLAEAPRAGVVAATGSWQRGITGITTGFPNYHVRTTAFMIRRDVLTRIRCAPIRTKQGAYRFEHGPNGLTRQILAMGLEPYVVGRNGAWYPKERWPESATYLADEERNLLVSDNHTAFCRHIDPLSRRQIAHSVWGEAARSAIPSA